MEAPVKKVQPAINRKLVTCQPRPKKKTCNPDGSIPEPPSVMWFWLADTFFNSCQMTSTWMCNIRLQAPTPDKKCDISHWFPCAADGRTGGRKVTWLPKISRLDRLPHFLSYGAPLARGAPLWKVSLLVMRGLNNQSGVILLLMISFSAQWVAVWHGDLSGNMKIVPSLISVLKVIQ